MFESITSHKRGSDFLEAPFSIGHICECLFFYGQVNVVCSRLELAEIIRKTLISDLLPYLQSGRLRIFLRLESYGATRLNPGRFAYTIVQGKGMSVESEVYRASHAVLRNSVKALKESDVLLPYINEYRFEADLINEFITYGDFAKGVLRTIVGIHDPTFPIPVDLRFALNKTDKLRYDDRELAMIDVYELDTNFDFSVFERHLAAIGTTYSLGFLPQLSMNMVGAILDLGLSQKFESELALETTSSKIIQAGLETMQLGERDGQGEILQFQEHVLAPYNSISEVIDSGRRSFSDFVELDRNADKFRGWLIGKSLDFGVVNAYIEENELKRFSDSEVGTGLKYIFSKAAVSALSAAAPAAAAASTAGAVLTMVGGYGVKKVVDSVVSKFNRWRPNQFINKDVREFLKGN